MNDFFQPCQQRRQRTRSITTASSDDDDEPPSPQEPQPAHSSVQAQLNDIDPSLLTPELPLMQYPRLIVDKKPYILESWTKKRGKRSSWIHKHGNVLCTLSPAGKAVNPRWFCTLCDFNGKTLLFDLRSTTSPARHLSTGHGIIEHGSTPAKAPVNGPSVLSQLTANRTISKPRSEKFMDLLLGFIIDCDVPFNAVQRSIFREFMQFLDADTVQSSMTNGRGFRQKLHDAYKRRRRELAVEIENSKSCIHISWDLWTMPNNKAILAVCGHFVDANYQLQTRLLALEELIGAHTGANQAAIIIDVITEDFNFPQKLGYFVGDNVESNDLAVRHVLHEIWPLDSFYADYSIPHPKEHQHRLRCITHILNLVAKAFLFGKDGNSLELEDTDGTEETQVQQQRLEAWRKHGPIGKLHNTVKYIRASPQRLQVREIT